MEISQRAFPPRREPPPTSNPQRTHTQKTPPTMHFCRRHHPQINTRNNRKYQFVPAAAEVTLNHLTSCNLITFIQKTLLYLTNENKVQNLNKYKKIKQLHARV